MVKMILKPRRNLAPKFSLVLGLELNPRGSRSWGDEGPAAVGVSGPRVCRCRCDPQSPLC